MLQLGRKPILISGAPMLSNGKQAGAGDGFIFPATPSKRFTGKCYRVFLKESLKLP
jgi:hypothetical protein